MVTLTQLRVSTVPNTLLFSAPDHRARFVAKIADFGLATGVGGSSLLSEHTTRKRGGGTLAYKSPEAFEDQYEAASEVFSYAICVWECLVGDRPWQRTAQGRTHTEATLVRAILKGERPELPNLLH